MTLFERIKEAGVTHRHHESDLYLPDTLHSYRIIGESEKENGMRYCVTRFWNHVEGGMWIDVPFQYDPWWESHRR